MINNLAQDIQVGAIYQHYKGGLYKIIAVGRSSENPVELFVVYQGLKDCPDFGKKPVWVRPFDLFAGLVSIEGKLVVRFVKIDE